MAPYGWRRRARLHWVRTAGSQAALVGLYAPRSRRVTQVAACPQIEPALEAALPAIHAVLAPGLFQRGRSISCRDPAGAGPRGGHAGRVARATPRRWSGRAAWWASPRRVRSSAPPRSRSSPASAARADRFAQASRAGNAALIAAVARDPPAQGARILELYAGSGNLTRTLLDGAASAWR